MISGNFRKLTDYADQVKYIQPIMQRLGSDIPAEGMGVVFAQFDAQDEVVAFQILQVGVFAEGLYARDGSAQLPTIWKMLETHMLDLGNKGRDLLTMVKGDATGQRIGRILTKRLKFEELDWKVYRRKI